MTYKRHCAVMLGAAILIGLASPVSAEDDYCGWGGDNGQSMECFGCMKREWTGQEWRLVNTCKRSSSFIFHIGEK